MLKRVQVHGFVEVPEGSELPDLGQVVTVSEARFEVTGELKEKQARRGEAVELVFTRKTRLLEGAQILKVEAAPEPLFEDESGDEGS